jgi:hypothetical protein
MTKTTGRPAKFGFYSAVAILVGMTVACNSTPATKTADDKSGTPASSSTKSVGPDIDLNCVINHLQKPPEAFHYLFKVDSADNPVSEEADVTPQKIDVTFKNRNVPAPVHLQDTPEGMPHQYVWAIGRMASLFALVRGTVVDEGQERVNGYSATKLSIDTTRGNAAEQGLYKSTLGPGGFAKGTVWVTSEGCPVKLDIDQELHANDGTVSGKAHYDEAMVKQ